MHRAGLACVAEWAGAVRAGGPIVGCTARAPARLVSSVSSKSIGKFSSEPGASACSDCPVGGYCGAVGAASASQTFQPYARTGSPIPD